MSARHYRLQLAGIACVCREMLVQVPPSDVVVSSCGVEFRSPFPLPLWVELQVELSRGCGGASSTRQGIVVACDPTDGGCSRVALLFLDSGDAEKPLSA
jgi:hypothetical protein